MHFRGVQEPQLEAARLHARFFNVRKMLSGWKEFNFTLFGEQKTDSRHEEQASAEQGRDTTSPLRIVIVMWIFVIWTVKNRKQSDTIAADGLITWRSTTLI